jgi:arylsulfatase A-like enzyme
MQSIAALLIAGLLLLAGAAAARENFLVIVADDLGVDSVAVYGEGSNPGPTPHIDGLAAQGILFRNAYTNPVCAPTRAEAMTGRYGFRTGIGVAGGAVLDLSETTLAEMLGATHETAAIGKWHLGRNDVDHPIDSGFDYYAGALTSLSGDYYAWNKTTNSTTTTGSTQTGYSTYATIDNADEAISSIAAFGESPWFVWLAFSAPHGPYHVPPPELTTIAVDEDSDDATKYKAAVEAMDHEIGRVLASIPQGILDDTTIVFLGDNGTPGRVSEAPFESSHAKGSMYEGGINVPFIVKSPWIDPADRGSESAAFVISTDLFATLAEIAGVVASAEDSISIVPYLQDPDLPTQAARPYAYAERFSPNGDPPYDDEQRAIRDDAYKLIWRNGAYEEFFDLAVDPFETDNLLPVSNLDPEELAAYENLVETMEAIPLPEPGAELGLAVGLAFLALVGRSRYRP